MPNEARGEASRHVLTTALAVMHAFTVMVATRALYAIQVSPEAVKVGKNLARAFHENAVWTFEPKRARIELSYLESKLLDNFMKFITFHINFRSWDLQEDKSSNIIDVLKDRSHGFQPRSE